MLRLPTISEVPRAVLCAASVALPREEEREVGAAAKRGTRIHAWTFAHLRGWPLPDVGRTKVAHIDITAMRAFLEGYDIKCELALSYDGKSVEVLGENIGREYNRPGTLCGSIDIAGIMAKHGLVIDVKTGALPVPPPVENWQVATSAGLFGLAHPELDDVSGVIATLARDGSWSFGEAHTWSRADLTSIVRNIDEHRTRWHNAYEMNESGWGATPSPGAHCRFCKCICESNAFAKEAA